MVNFIFFCIIKFEKQNLLKGIVIIKIKNNYLVHKHSMIVAVHRTILMPVKNVIL